MVAEFDIDGFVARCHGAAAVVPPADWDACGTAGHPFVQHRHLLVLEACGLATPAAGFHPRLLLLRDRDGAPAGAAPAYLKTTSAGEAGVDLGLPLAHMRAARPYYPKLQVEVPMIPTPGPRLLVRPGADAPRVRRALLAALWRLAEAEGASSVQISHGTPEDQAAAAGAGFAPSEGNTFVWRSRGEASFAEFVATMHQKGRHRIRHDRALAAAANLSVERVTGASVTPACAARAYEFYVLTHERHGSRPYLSPGYFRSAFAAMPDAFDLPVARRGEAWAAMMVAVRGARSLHVQHWGAAETGGSVIFEMLYRELEAGIAAGLEAVDFGPAGRHKSLRGIGIEPTRHALWFRDARFQEVAAAAAERAVEEAKLPFKDRAARSGAFA